MVEEEQGGMIRMKTSEEIRKQLQEHEECLAFYRNPNEAPMPACIAKLSKEKIAKTILNKDQMYSLEAVAIGIIKWVLD